MIISCARFHLNTQKTNNKQMKYKTFYYEN